MLLYLANYRCRWSGYWYNMLEPLCPRCSLLLICRFGFSNSLFRQLTACCLLLFFSSFNLLLRPQENNKLCNNFTIVSSPPIMPLNWSYSWTWLKRFPILRKGVLFPFLGARALRQFLPPVHQLFERKNANRSSYWRTGWQLKIRSRRTFGIIDQSCRSRE